MNEESTTKLANFVASAFECSQEYLLDVFENTTSMAERNLHIIIDCFSVYLDVYQGMDTEEMDEGEYNDVFDEFYDSFLAESVRLTFLD